MTFIFSFSKWLVTGLPGVEELRFPESVTTVIDPDFKFTWNDWQISTCIPYTTHDPLLF